jgi:NDP-sugar pyrophosphorylase family protein
MKAVILAAGLGTRLLPLTRETPKLLVPVVNRPIIDIIIDNLKTVGTDQIGINLHHLPDRVRGYLGYGEKHNVSITYSFEETLLETGGGLANFADFVGDDPYFIVHNCDPLTSIDLSKALKFHEERRPVATLVVIDRPQKNSVLIDKLCRVRDIGGKLGVFSDETDCKLCGAAIFIYSSEIFKYLPRNNTAYSVIPVLLEIIRNNPGAVLAYHPDERYYWEDIGNSVGIYLDVHHEILTGNSCTFPGIARCENGIWIHDKAEISERAVIEGFASIGAGVKINAGAVIRNCVIWDNVSIPTGSVFENAVISTSHIVNG